MIWKNLLTTALVGTERRPLTFEDTPEPFRELAAQLEHEAPERALLALAGAMTLHQRVGQTPQIDAAPLLDPCEADDLPACSPRAGLRLGQILALAQHKPHLQEWIRLAVERGQRVSEEYLPMLLTHLNRATLPEGFYAVLGKRGRWLAQQNEGWAYAMLPRTEAEWEFASFPARLEFLRPLRASDPAHTRTLIGTMWKTENSDNRQKLVEVLAINLSSEDEAFLEGALKDRAGGVRSSAARLLAALPGSAYSQRVSERARPLIRIGWKKNRLSKKLMIDLTLPDASDLPAIRDELGGDAPANSEYGVQGYWLSVLAAALPAAYWLGGDWSPGDLVSAADAHDDWRKLLLDALARVAERDAQHELGAAQLEVALEGATETAALRAALPQAREARALALLAKNAAKDESALLLLRYLCEIEHRWSGALTHAAAAYVRKLSEQNAKSGMAYTYAAYLPVYAYCMSLEVLPELRKLEDEKKLNAHWLHALKQAASILEFRRDMLKEFAR